MVYSNKSSYKQVGFLNKLKVKMGKRLAKNFPLNSVRIWGLKLCDFKIQKNVYIGEELIIASIISEKSCQLEIENRVAIGPRVTLILSSDANWSHLMKKIPPIKGKIILEHDCWIGAGSIILPNIKIGHNSIVAAGAVVTKDVLPNTVVAGVPAKKIKDI
ncbi:MAG: acyltransferase [Candidatus Peribacteraceae bacterium]|nr:acyltransferase [Candidatus Peribacteraceae bacterium]